MDPSRLRTLAVPLLIVAMLSIGCSREGADETAQQAPPATAPAGQHSVAVPRPVSAATEPAEEAYFGDLAALKRRGRLRILIPANIGGVFYLPRAGWPVEVQHEAVARFARRHGLEPVLVPVERASELIPSLVSGRGDIIAANFTVTEARRQQIAFSVPLTTVRQQVLVAASSTGVAGVEDLVGRRVMVDRGSSFWERLEALRGRHPGIELIERPLGLSDEDELDRVAAGEIDASVRDSNIATMYLSYRDDLKVAFELPGTDDIAWGVRRDAPRLRAALNQFLHLELLSGDQPLSYRDGWERIRERRVLRVLLRNNAASYFLYRGELHGFEYELAKAFADAHKLRLEVVVPDNHEQLLQWLIDGRGDVAAGFLEPRDALAMRGLAFSEPYHFAPRHLVVREGDEIRCAQDLDGRRVAVRRSSPYWADLERLRASGIDLQPVAAPEDVETEELIAQVAAGEIEATVADGHLLDIELARGLPVRSGLQLDGDRAHAVAVRAENRELLGALNGFIKKHYRGLVYNILYKKYFTNPRKVRDLAAGRPQGRPGQGLSPYDGIVRRYAEQYGFDWRLIVAQMFQESRFDPKAKSFAGAQGLMQVLPRTARFMGFDTISGPEEAVHAGVKYLDWVRNRFEAELPFNERLWFSLAAYNAGHGHVQDARRLARKQGWDGNRWFDHVEKAMLLLSKKQYASEARYGYVRGVEPVSYVRDIRERYRAYVDIEARRMGDKAPGQWAQLSSPSG